MTVGFITTCAISTYYNKGCEFESISGEVYSSLIDKADLQDMTEIVLKVALNTITLTLIPMTCERSPLPTKNVKDNKHRHHTESFIHQFIIIERSFIIQ
jgi:hypothetical protein